MQCDTFHRQALSDPLRLDPEALRHAGDCPSCARFYIDLCRQEAALYQCLGQPIPGALADPQKRLTRRTPATPRTTRLPRALALSVALSVALGIGLVALTRPDPLALAGAAIDHVRGEPQALVNDQRLAPKRIADAFDRAGGVLVGAPEVSYAGRCPLPGGGLGEHLVLRLPEGKATLVLMPSKRVSTVARAARDGLHAMVRPAGKGSLALVAGSDTLIGTAEAYLRQHVRWGGEHPLARL